MPPKNAVQKAQPKGRGRRADDGSDSAIDALVHEIEGRVKKGTTKSQVKEVETKTALARNGNTPFVITDEMRAAYFAQMQAATMEAQYKNVEVPLQAEQLEWQEVAPNKYVRYEQFHGTDEEMNFIVKLFTEELTEPYSSFTYQYFVFGWPDLCITAYGVESATKPDKSVVGDKVGAVVSRVTRKGARMPLRGYLAMFAVVPTFRGYRLGSRLVALTADLMHTKGCDELYLETPTTNERAMNLYLGLGFAKTKFLPRYYLDQSDAVRLKLWLKEVIPRAAATEEEAKESTAEATESS